MRNGHFTLGATVGQPRVLFVGDENLGDAGFQTAGRFFSDITKIIWARGSSVAQARQTIRSERWDICLSFYSDLIFRAKDLEQIEGFAINFHPATPAIPGLGHDVVPILEGHDNYGATAHFMTEKIDDGPIVALRELPLPKAATRSWLRKANQKQAMALLEDVLDEIHWFDDVSSAYVALLNGAQKLDRQWGRQYYSGANVNGSIAAIQARNPRHEIFR